MKHFVIATEWVSAGKTHYAKGALVSSHAEESIARHNAYQLTRKHHRRFLTVELEGKQFKVGQEHPDIADQALAHEDDQRKLAIMVEVLEATEQGDEKKLKRIAEDMALLNMDLQSLRETYQARARDALASAQAKRQDIAAKAAKATAVASSLRQAASDITYSFPAVRGVQAGREYYAVQVPYAVVAKVFLFDEEDVLPPESRAQRVLNERRAQAICEYITENPTDYVLPAMTASVSAEMSFEPMGNDAVGVLHIPMSATILINDGQHRRAGIELAMRKAPNLAKETVAVTMFYDQGLARSQQMFSDINSKQVKPSSAINALYDRRNPFNAWIMKVLDELPRIKRRIDFENSSVGPKSHKLWSLVGFKRFVTLMLGVSEKTIGNYDDKAKASMIDVLAKFFEHCDRVIPQWKAMIDGGVSASEVRESWVLGHTVWLHGLGVFGSRLLGGSMNSDHVSWQKMDRLALVDPMRSSKMWEGRCVVMGKMQMTPDGVKSTAAKLLTLCNFALFDLAEVEKRLAA